MKYKITVAYDGTDFCGWQSQPSGNSVQDALEKAVFSLSGERVRVTGSGRTDAGVHARRQVADFCLEKEFPTSTVVNGLNAYLPRTVRVIRAEIAESDFDARRSAKQKTYMYLMYTGKPTPLLNDRAYCIGETADVAAMREAADRIVGTHDFKSFMAANSGAKTSVRTVYNVELRENGSFIEFYITANGFLYNMVRIIAALLIKAGKGEKVDMEGIIAARDRTRAKDVAPPYGLYLWEVTYADGRSDNL